MKQLGQLQTLLFALPLLGLGWACSGEGNGIRPGSSGGDGMGTTSGTGGGSGGNVNTTGNPTGSGGSQSTGTGTGGTGAVGTDGPVSFNLDCDAPAVGAPTLRLLTKNEFNNTIDDVFPGIAGQWQNTLPASPTSSTGFDNASTNTVGNQLAKELLSTAESVASAVTGNALQNLLPCAGTGDRACAEQFLDQYGLRLFRRPLSDAERTRYLDFFDGALASSDFATALKWVTVGLIQSPSAVYRSEIGTTTGNGSRQLTPHELATELAYTFTGSTPSQQLLESAASGSLGNLQTRANELVSSPAGQRAIQRFFEGYLDYPNVSATLKPSIAGFDAAKADMVEETQRFIESVVLQGNGGVRELLTSPTTNPSSALASYYGFPAPGSDFASIQRPAGQGVGILAQGSFLASHANPDASSPTRRGLFPYLRLLCQVKPELPDDVPELKAPEPGVKTTRQRYEETHVSASPACANCHKLFDPIGFGFEHFDEGGRYRETEQGLTIDATGSVLDAAGNELFAFDGQEQLMQMLAEQDIVYQCFSAYLATYAFGSAQSCLGPSQAESLQAGTLSISQAFAALASEPHFTQRTAQ